jgi:quercetin dioxygenase-like cupin family protein
VSVRSHVRSAETVTDYYAFVNYAQPSALTFATHLASRIRGRGGAKCLMAEAYAPEELSFGSVRSYARSRQSAEDAGCNCRVECAKPLQRNWPHLSMVSAGALPMPSQLRPHCCKVCEAETHCTAVPVNSPSKVLPMVSGQTLALRIFTNILQMVPIAAGMVAFEAADLDAQRTVVVYHEPRHRVVRDEGDVKLMDIQIQPGDTTLSHTHDSPILYTFISSGTGPSGGRVSSNTEYLQQPFTHAVSNAGPQLFRIIAMSAYGPGDPNAGAARADGLAVEPQLENSWFRSYRLELAPGQTTAVHRHRYDVALVQVTDGQVEVSKENGFGAELNGMGSWAWREAESPYTIKNVGTAPVAVVINEAKRPR